MKTNVIDLVFKALDRSQNSSFYWIDFERMIMDILKRLAREHPKLSWIAGYGRRLIMNLYSKEKFAARRNEMFKIKG